VQGYFLATFHSRELLQESENKLKEADVNYWLVEDRSYSKAVEVRVATHEDAVKAYHVLGGEEFYKKWLESVFGRMPATT